MTVQTDFLAPLTTSYAGERNTNSVLRRVLGWVSYQHTLLRDRREVRRLLDLDPKLLTDMGLDRADIDWALAHGADMLPSHRLQACRAERSRARLVRLGIRQQ